MKDLAKISALSYKAKQNGIVIVEDISMEAPATKQFTGIFKSLNAGKRKTLFVLPEYNENVYKSFRNVPSVCGTLLTDVNTYDIVNSDVVIFTESAAKLFLEETADNGKVAEA